MNPPDWRSIFDQIWNGLTLHEACDYLDADYTYVQDMMTPQIRYFIIDVSMVVGVREEMLKDIIGD